MEKLIKSSRPAIYKKIYPEDVTEVEKIMSEALPPGAPADTGDAGIVLELSTLFSEKAKIVELDKYIQIANNFAGEGNDIILSGNAPVWLYLKVAHALHGKALKLSYSSPVTGEVVIFDHNPF